MIDTTGWIWICDKTQMICRNVENSVIVKIDRIGKTFNGKLQGIPLELFGKIARLKNGELIIQKIIRSAEEEFLKAYPEINCI